MTIPLWAVELAKWGFVGLWFSCFMAAALFGLRCLFRGAHLRHRWASVDAEIIKYDSWDQPTGVIILECPCGKRKAYREWEGTSSMHRDPMSVPMAEAWIKNCRMKKP
jgi:hypothetical protein